MRWAFGISRSKCSDRGHCASLAARSSLITSVACSEIVHFFPQRPNIFFESAFFGPTDDLEHGGTVPEVRTFCFLSLGAFHRHVACRNCATKCSRGCGAAWQVHGTSSCQGTSERVDSSRTENTGGGKHNNNSRTHKNVRRTW